MSNKIGVYICHCGSNIAGKVDCADVARFSGGLKDVVVARDYQFMCSDPGQEMVIRDIREYGLSRVVVASCSPRLHEKTFQKACARAGLNPYLMQHACIREHCSWTTANPEEATSKAKHIVEAAVNRVGNHHELFSREVEVLPDVMVVGAGIAGIQASLDIAKSGHKVHLVEKSPSIGGHMAQFDKTFPTLDCAACISTPKMVAVSQEPNINLMTWSEVEDVTGFVGNYTVTVLHKPRYVNTDVCTGCGACLEKCPTKAISEFNEGLSMRKAIYRNSPQAVPNTPGHRRHHLQEDHQGQVRHLPEDMSHRGHRIRHEGDARGLPRRFHRAGHRVRHHGPDPHAGIRVQQVRRGLHRPPVRAAEQRGRPHGREDRHEERGSRPRAWASSIAWAAGTRTTTSTVRAPAACTPSSSTT